MAAGHALVHLPLAGSTMDEARSRLTAGRQDPVWVVADAQEAGRGRHGRNWQSPPGNLYATLLLPAPCEPAVAAELGFVAGLALHRAVSEATGLDAPALALKWPNDLLLGGAKVAGLLLEGTQAHGSFAVLIGMGVNIVSAPDDTAYPAAALADSAPDLTRDALFAALGPAWLREWQRWRMGFSFTRTQWLKLAHGLGQTVRVRPPGGEITGIMRGVDARGRLLLGTEAGEITVDAGDLFFGD